MQITALNRPAEAELTEPSPSEQLPLHPVLTSDDREVFCDLTSELFSTRYHFESAPNSQPVVARVNLVELGSVKIAYSELGTPTEFVVDEFDCYMVSMQLAGQMQVTAGGDSIVSCPSQAAVFYPQTSGKGSWSGTPQVLVNIRHEAVELELERQLNRPVEAPIRFELGMDLHASLAQSWLATLHQLQVESGRPEGCLAHPMLAKQMEQVLIAQLLYAQGHSYSEELLRPQEAAVPKVVQAAIDLIEASPDTIFTASDLAAGVFVSARTLQDGFRRHVGMAPMSYLRQVRLARVHADLLAARRDTESVTQIACRWGFSHLGRFAGDYQKKYGVLPSETLNS